MIEKRLVVLKENKVFEDFTNTPDKSSGISRGAEWLDCEQGFDGNYYLKGFAPEKPPLTNEEIKAERERLYTLYADDLKNDYDEDVARYGLESPEALSSKKIWLDKKDEIRESNPYTEVVE